MKSRRFRTILSFVVTILSLVLVLFGLNTKAHADGLTYEEPDYISVGDLLQNNKPVGNKIVTTADTRFTYNKTKTHGSVVFSFLYKITTWSNDIDGSQFHFYSGYQMNGAFWFKPGYTLIMYYDENGNVKYEAGPKNALGVGTYNVEIGRLAIMNGDEYTGDQYFYIKINDTLCCEHTISGLEDPQIKSNGFFVTGKGGVNAMIDANWEGTYVKYMSNGEVISEGRVLDDYLTRPADPTLPGKTFKGWYDEMGNEWDFEHNQLTNDLTLRAGFVSNDPGVSDEVYFSDSNFTPVLRFMVASDAHIGTSASRRDTNLGNAIDEAYRVANSNSKYSKLDAALFAGDISDNGDALALSRFKTIADEHIKEGTQLIASMGNHDFRGETVENSISQFRTILGIVDSHLIINGYHFIILSPDINDGCNFSDAKVEWLDAQLALAQEADPTKPIFVMQHEHIKGTVYGSNNWGVTELTDVLCKYPQVVDFSGHSHHPLSDPRSIWQGTFTALGTGTLHYYEVGINGYKTSGLFPAGGNGEYSTGASEKAAGAEIQIIEVDANNAIRVIVYDVNTQTEITRYYIRNAMDDIKFKYSHTERERESEAPTFAADQKPTLSTYRNTITVKFSAATSKDVMDSYRIEVYKATDLVKTEYVLADSFIIPNPTEFEVTFNKLQTDTEYMVRVYAVNVWGLESEVPLKGTIRTEDVDFDPETFEPYDLINISDVDIPGNNGVLANIPSESKVYNYPGKAANYTAVLQYYLITGDLTSKDEFRTQVGTNWQYYITFWIQTGKYDVIFSGWIYSTKPSDRIKFNIESNRIYKIEYGTIEVATGEHEGEYYVFVKVDDVLLSSFYIPAEEFNSKNYNFTTHITDNYMIADINNARTIEYIVDGVKYQEDFAISGLNITEPVAPTKEGHYFAGWYTAPEGGDRVDFDQIFTSTDKTVKYYARFTDQAHDLKIYSEGELLQTQKVGHDCQALRPVDPTKTGAYNYVFVKWVIRGTNEEFSFDTRIQDNLEIEAVFEEQKYRIVYLVDGMEYITKYFVESNPSEIIGGEPQVPALIGATGHWVYSGERTNKDIYVRAIYDGTSTTPSEEISLNKFNGSTVDIADDLTRFYMSFADTDEQAEWIQSYPVSGGHERQNISFSWTDTSRNTAYLVYFADNANFTNAFIVETDKRSIDYVGIFTPGKTYYWKVIGITNEKASAVDTFTVLNTPVRWISAGTVYNVRDIGGYQTTDGMVVNYGLVYRGGQLSLDQTGEVSYMNAYSFKVFDYLGMTTEIELRGDKPHEYNQFNELENLILVNGNNYMGMFSLNAAAKENYREVFHQLADINNYPFYFHCSWGADRTGTLGFLINGLLGVPYERLVEDYELTSLSNSGTRTRYGWSNGAFYEMYQTFLSSYANGGTLQDGITNYLKSYIGVTDEEIAAIKAIMLSPATDVLTTHTVTYMIGDEIYQRALIFDGGYIKEIAPVYFEKHLDCWLLNGEPFDPTTKVTTDLTLVARFANTRYEDYDIVTMRDLGLGETYKPTAQVYSIEGTSNSGSRMLVFDYIIRADDQTFDDGVHIEIGPTAWDYRAHVWFQGLTSIHIFTDGSQPVATYNRHFEYGKQYQISVGVVIPIDGQYAGKKMFIVLIDGEILSFIPTTADISSTFNIGLAGTEGIMRSIENKKTVTFIDASGTTVDTQEIVRGNYATEIDIEGIANKVFLGWYDELGNVWNFNTSKVLKDTKLFAKFGDRTIDAMVVDEFNREIAHGYKVKIGITVAEIETPLVPSSLLNFDGWYNGDTKLSPTDVITEDMNLICVFSVVEVEPVEPVDPVEPVEPVEPVDPVNPVDPVDPKNGCKSFATPGFYLIGMALIGGAIILKKKKEEERK